MMHGQKNIKYFECLMQMESSLINTLNMKYQGTVSWGTTESFKRVSSKIPLFEQSILPYW